MSIPTKFAEAIAEAAAQADHGVAAPSVKGRADNPSNGTGDALADAKAGFAAAAERVRVEYGCAVIWQAPRIGRKRTAAEYAFWKRPLATFVDFPDTLDLGATALARQFAPSEQNFTVTRDTFRGPLSEPARKEAGRFLKQRGHTLTLPANFSILDVQKAMKDKRDRAAGVKSFNPKVEVIGDTVRCTNKSYKMQKTGNGKLRIKAGGGWLPVEALLAFLAD